MKIALITGITGQDGAYLAELLLEKGYEVHGIKRRSSSFNTQRIEHLYQDPHVENQRFFLHYGDLTDATNLIRIIQNIQPDEIYNLGAQSHVAVSFESPEYTADTNAMGTLRLLEAIRILKLEGKTRFYQASTSELYGKVSESPQSETTAFQPRSPYAAAKLYAYWMTVNITRKITRAVAAIDAGQQEMLYLGNLNSIRDWGHARDFVRGMWMMLQQDKPGDYVLATGETTTVREFAEWAFTEIGVEIEWRGEGVDEAGYIAGTDICRIEVDPRYFRPTEVGLLCGDASKAKAQLGWSCETNVRALIREMVAADKAALS